MSDNDFAMHPDEIAAQVQRTHDYVRTRYGADMLPDFIESLEQMRRGEGAVLAPKPEAVHLVEAIGNDEDPGLTGEALDAWNAATVRAVNIARNWGIR